MADLSQTGARKSRRDFLFDASRLAAATAVGGGLLAACENLGPTGPGVQTGGTAGQLPRNQTLFISGFQWGPPTNFNPLNGPGAAWPVGGGVLEHLYETLFGYNQLSGELEPLLANQLTWKDKATAVIHLRAGTTWQDGTPLTADDVVYTYELGQRHSNLPYSTFWQYVSDLRPTDDQTIQLQLVPDRINAGLVKNFLATTRIVPKHIWQRFDSSDRALIEYDNLQPVGSGPYKIMDRSPERVALIRHDGYWGKSVFGTPRPRYLVHPIFKSNDDGNLALQRGEVDLSQQFAPRIWLMWQAQHAPVGTWYNNAPYYVPGSIPMLFINVHKRGLDDPTVRRALAFAINYPQIAAVAMSRYSVPAHSSLILPQGAEGKFFDQTQVKTDGWEYNPKKATALLEKAGAKRGGDGIYVLPNGTRLGPFKVQTPYGWTDWNSALEIVGQSAQAAGIDVQIEFPDAPVVTTRMKNGDFDLALWYVSGVGPASPWVRFHDLLDIRGVPDVGQPAFWNYNRFSNRDVPDLLDQAAAATSETDQQHLYAQLDAIFMHDVPAIPLMYRPFEFYQYNESVWTGFPNAQHPSAPPMHSGAGIRLLYVIRPKG